MTALLKVMKTKVKPVKKIHMITKTAALLIYNFIHVESLILNHQ